MSTTTTHSPYIPVRDDWLARRSETILIGTCPELTRHHMELRGLGLINIKDLFGIASTRSSKRVELVALAGAREVWGLNALINGPL